MFQVLLNKLVSRHLRPILVNWKTSLIGAGIICADLREILANLGNILQYLVGVADGATMDIEHIKQLAIQLGAGVALLFAKDANKSTEASIDETPVRKALPYP